MTKKEKRQNKKSMDNFAVKATYLAGIVLLIAMSNDILKLWIEWQYLSLVCGIVSFLLVIFILCFHKLDNKILSPKGKVFGNSYTVVSIFVFIIERFTTDYISRENCFEDKLAITILFGAIILMFPLAWKFIRWKYDSN